MLHVAECEAKLLRICAPETPYTDEELKVGEREAEEGVCGRRAEVGGGACGDKNGYFIFGQ